jgi:hypothetical protein
VAYAIALAKRPGLRLHFWMICWLDRRKVEYGGLWVSWGGSLMETTSKGQDRRSSK